MENFRSNLQIGEILLHSTRASFSRGARNVWRRAPPSTGFTPNNVRTPCAVATLHSQCTPQELGNWWGQNACGWRWCALFDIWFLLPVGNYDHNFWLFQLCRNFLSLHTSFMCAPLNTYDKIVLRLLRSRRRCFCIAIAKQGKLAPYYHIYSGGRLVKSNNVLYWFWN